MEKLKEEIKRKQEEARLLKLKQQEEQVSQKNGLAERLDSSESAERDNQIAHSKKLAFIRQKDRIMWNQEQLERRQQELEEERLHKKQKISSGEPNTVADSKLKPEVKTSTKAKDSKDEKLEKCKDLSELFNEKLQRFQHCSTRELQLKLRSLRQPITLFGESREDRLHRLVEYLLRHNSEINDANDDEYRLQDRKKEALARAKEEASFDAEDEDRRNSLHSNDSDKRIGNFENGSDEGKEKRKEKGKRGEGSDGEESEEEDRQSRKSSLRYDPLIQYHKMSDLAPEKMIYKFFRSLIKQWEYDLHQRPENEKATMKGKLELKSQKQCKDHIRPLFKLCQQKAIPYDIQQKLLLMVTYCEQGNFIKANDEYIKTAIGNSAWPIGLTMVGIHERSGRERISTSKIAHIMNNEEERKYLTAVKRLMTYCQTKRPEVPPSLKVLT